MSKLLETVILGTSLVTAQIKEKDEPIFETTVSETQTQVSNVFNLEEGRFNLISSYYNSNKKPECKYHNITNLKDNQIGYIAQEKSQITGTIGYLSLSQVQKEFEVFLNQNTNIEKKEGDLIIEYDCEEYDLTRFQNKVLNPIVYLLAQKGENIDILNLLKIAMTENSGSTHSSEVKYVLNLLTADNYLQKINTESNKGAKGLFQVMPPTANYLDDLFGISKLLEEQEGYLKTEFNITKEKDFAILKNALYAGFYLKYSENYLTKRKQAVTDEKLAKIYNGGPKALRTMASETKRYIKKFNNAAKILRENKIIFIENKWENIVAKLKKNIKKVFKS